MMPKGVEHLTRRVFSGDRFEVIHSLMPKGVEHCTKSEFIASARPVIHSLMPKGVEHLPIASGGIGLTEGDSFVDAERR